MGPGAGKRPRSPRSPPAADLTLPDRLLHVHPCPPASNLQGCSHFQMEFLKVKINALKQKAQMFNYEINGALKNTLRNTIG